MCEYKTGGFEGRTKVSGGRRRAIYVARAGLDSPPTPPSPPNSDSSLSLAHSPNLPPSTPTPVDMRLATSLFVLGSVLSYIDARPAGGHASLLHAPADVLQRMPEGRTPLSRTDMAELARRAEMVK